jgi:hypothetical protein
MDPSRLQSPSGSFPHCLRQHKVGEVRYAKISLLLGSKMRRLPRLSGAATASVLQWCLASAYLSWESLPSWMCSDCTVHPCVSWDATRCTPHCGGLEHGVGQVSAWTAVHEVFVPAAVRRGCRLEDAVSTHMQVGCWRQAGPCGCAACMACGCTWCLMLILILR